MGKMLSRMNQLAFPALVGIFAVEIQASDQHGLLLNGSIVVVATFETCWVGLTMSVIRSRTDSRLMHRHFSV
jgi:hypothetical protein